MPRTMRLFTALSLVAALVSMTFAQSGRQVFGADATRPFSAAAKAGGLVYVAGTIGADANNKGDIKAQTKQTLENIDKTLKAAGSSLANAASTMVYLRSPADFAAMNAAYRPYFTAGSMPARATARTGLASPDYLVEITMVAVKDSSRKAITTPNADGTASTANPNLSSAIQVGNRLYVAGITGNTASNKGDAKAQTAETLARIERTMKTAGFEWPNVVDSMVYLPDMANYQSMNAAYREALKKDFPARATVGTGLMGADAAVEIMMTAVK